MNTKFENFDLLNMFNKSIEKYQFVTFDVNKVYIMYIKDKNIKIKILK